MSEKEAIGKLSEIPGVGPATAKKLIEAGYTTLEDIAGARPEELAGVVGTAKKAKKIIEAAAHLLHERIVYAVKAAELEKERLEKVQLIPTGSRELNTILGGGFRTDSVYLIAGPFGTGKTQLCYEAVVTCVCKLKRDAVYIETEPQCFQFSRLLEIAECKAPAWAKSEEEARGLKDEVKKLLVERVYAVPSTRARTPRGLYLAYEWVDKRAEKGEIDPGVLVVDSFSAPFRAFYSGRELLPDRNAEMARHFGKLQEIADKYNCCVILTSQVYSVPDIGGQIRAEVTFDMDKAIWGGDYMLHAATYIIVLQKFKKNVSIATLVDSSHLPRASCMFKVTPAGIEDVEEKKK